MSDVTGSNESLPWFVKAIIVVAVLVVLFIVGIDLLTFAGAF
jgi:hypothetical protein